MKIKFLFLSLLLFSCQSIANKEKKTDDLQTLSRIEITGNVSADLSFAEQNIVTSRLVTGRIITGRIVTSRSPSLQEQKKVRVGGARIIVEELGISAETDLEGNFSMPVTITSKCPCKFSLSVGSVRKDGKSYKTRQEIEITQEDIKNGKKDLGTITIYATGGIAGKVTLKDAESSLGAYVYIPGTPMVGTTDENGNFIIGDIPAGNYRIVIEKHGYERKVTDNVQVESGKITSIGDFELNRGEEKFVYGRVVDLKGKPIAGAFIISDSGRVAISDRYGSFQIPADSKAITVGKEGYETKNITIDKTEKIEIELSPENLKTGAIKGKIYNWITTKPVGGVSVVCLPSGNATVTANDGSFVLEDISPGNYTLMFIRRDYEIGIEIVSVGNGQIIDLGSLGLLPECVLTKFYKDSDGDGFGDASSYVEDCYAPYGYVGNTNDCNDSDVSSHPGAVEICNSKDDNCNSEIDEFVSQVFYKDQDSDGYGDPNFPIQACSKPFGYVINNLDCNDSNKDVKPTSVEICDVADQDCDGFVNDGILSYFYKDNDGDGQGSSSSGITSACSDSSNRLRDINGIELTGGWSENSLDCNDANSSIKFGINETSCNGIDENCNGITDDGVLITFYRDSDADGYGDLNFTRQACSAPYGFVSNREDCNDSDPNFNPSITEIVDGRDENCDGTADNLVFSWEIIDSLSPVHYIDSAIDANGNIHVALNYTAYGGSRWLTYYRKTASAWNDSPSKRYLGSGDIYNCSIDVLSSGSTAYFSYSVTNGGTCADYGVCITSYSDGWSSGKHLNSFGRFSSIDIVENIPQFGGSVTHVVYSTGTSIVHTYAAPSTPDFSLSSVVAYTVGVTDIDMVVSQDGATVHIVFAGLDGGIYYPYYTRNLTPYNFNTWLSPVKIASYTYDIKSLGISLSPDGTTHICFTGENAMHLFYTKAKNGSFISLQQVDSGSPISSCSITVDSFGNPHIAYYSKPFGDIRYATLWDKQWKKYKIVSVDQFPQNKSVSILVDKNRIPHIVFIWNGFAAYAYSSPR